MKIDFKKERMFLISWILLPIAVLWITTNYLVGINKHTIWQTQSDPKAAGASTGTDLTTTSPATEIQKFRWQGEGLVTLWFDDAWISQFTVAYPLLESRNLKAALAVPTSYMGYEDYMSWNQVKLLNYKGWEITSHTRTHSCKESEMSDQFLEDELHGSLKDLNAHGIRADNFVTPCGINSDRENKVAKEYYLSLRTSFSGLNTLPIKDPYGLKVQAVRNNINAQQVKKWLQETRDQKSWLILMFHQVDNSHSEYSTTPAEFKRIVDQISTFGLPVVLPIQVLEMIVDTPQ